MLIVASIFLGVLASAVNQHYVIKEGTAPSYFLPGLVGLTVQVGVSFHSCRSRYRERCFFKALRAPAAEIGQPLSIFRTCSFQEWPRISYSPKCF